MITLVHENQTPPRAFRGVRVVKFKDVDDIRRQLTIAAGPASTLNPAAKPFTPTQVPSQSNGAELSVEATSDEANEDNAAQVPAEEEDTEPPEEGQAAEVAAFIESIGANFSGLSAEALAKQESAARVLQSYYRRLQINRAKRSELGLSMTRQTQFELFARAAESIEWPQTPRSLYRPVFLGALPHLLTCLDHTYSIIWQEKRKVKRQQARKSEKHQGIEGLMERQTNIKCVHNQRERMKT